MGLWLANTKVADLAPEISSLPKSLASLDHSRTFRVVTMTEGEDWIDQSKIPLLTVYRPNGCTDAQWAELTQAVADHLCKKEVKIEYKVRGHDRTEEYKTHLTGPHP